MGKIVQFGKSNKSAILMLHGFPGVKSDQNKDLAQYLAKRFTVFLFYYNGLGKAAGVFSFISSLSQSRAVFKKLIKHYDSVRIIGHSWGGLIAQNIFWEYPNLVSKLVLLSPISQIPNKSVIKNVLKEVSNSNFSLLKENLLLKELENIRKNNEPIKLALNKAVQKNKICLIQAKQDSEAPPRISKHLVKILKGRIKYIELDQDHNFLKNRIELFNTIDNFLSL